jgi:hypothetical protein
MCEYTSIRSEVKELYRNTCQHCFQCFPDTKLQVHHIKPKREGRDDRIENLIPLCGGSNTPECHAKVEREFIYKNIEGKVIYDCEETRRRNNLEILFPQLEERVPALAA